MSHTSSEQDLRRAWRKSWLISLFEFRTPPLQRQSWITGTGEWVSSYVECMCGYFDDLGLEEGYERLVAQGLLSQEEASLIEEFHAMAGAYEPPSGRDDHDAILADPAWNLVVAAAQRAWAALTPRLSDRDEVQLVASLEAESWRAPNTR